MPAQRHAQARLLPRKSPESRFGRCGMGCSNCRYSWIVRLKWSATNQLRRALNPSPASARCAGTICGPRGPETSIERHRTNLVSSSSRQRRAAPPSQVGAGANAVASADAVISFAGANASALSPRRRVSKSLVGSKGAPRPTCQSARASFRIKATTAFSDCFAL